MKKRYKFVIGCLAVMVLLCLIQICYLWGRSYFFMKELDKIDPVWAEHYPMPVSMEQYEKDKKYIVECFYDNVDYFRNRDLHQESIPESDSIYTWDRQYASFISCNSEEEGIVTSPISVRNYMKAEVDTILYSRDGKFCWCFVVATSNDFVYKNVKYHACSYGKKPPQYKGCAIVGVREDGRLKIYPDNSGLSISETDYRFTKGKKAVLVGLKHYYTQIKGWDYKFKDHIVNEACLGDSDFFEKTVYFKKYDDTTYYFQLNINANPVDRIRYRYPYGN